MAEAGTALARATHAVRVAESLRGADRRGRLDWASLCTWPDWALPEAESGAEPIWLRLGALAHGTALARCIDGERLRAAEALLGPALLDTIVADPPALQGGPPALPPPDELAATWRDRGRAIAIAALPQPALRNAVATVLGMVPAALPADIAQALCARAEALA
jgi:hypothetical protein